MEGRRVDLVVTGYVFNDQRKLLLIHHNKLDKWLPVGGHIEKDETPDAALLREIKEETNLDIDIIGSLEMSTEGNVKENLARPFHVNVHDVGDHDHCSFFYACTTTNQEKLKINEELRDFRWVGKEELDADYIQADVRTLALKAFELLKE